MSYVQKFSVKSGTNPANPMRLVEVGKFGDRAFEVVTGYDVTHDRWPVHLYSTDANGVRTKVPMGDSYADEPAAAFKRGWREIEEYFSL
ncbi:MULTISPECIES: hypothetical protein [unclassified Variovorax]|uniref:hypothetical protein n=1 Tax=unclassified Variovorax TaxID=663243 RepID=UPI003F486113